MPPLPSLARRLAARALLVLFLGTVAAAAASASLHPERRLPTLARVRADVDARCHAPSTDARVRASMACDSRALADGPRTPSVPIYKRAHEGVAAAVAAAARGDADIARLTADRVLAAAEDADRAGGLIGHLVAKRLREEVLDAVRARRDVFDDRFVAIAFARAAPASAREALLEQTITSERVALEAVAGAPALMRPLLAAYVPFEVERMTARRERMTAHASAGDRAACLADTQRSGATDLLLASQGLDGMLCEHAVALERARFTFEAERKGALARLGRRG